MGKKLEPKQRQKGKIKPDKETFVKMNIGSQQQKDMYKRLKK